jgi:uncharacterized protein (TIGR02246 family)
MKVICFATLVLLLVVVGGCAQKVNNPGDIEAIKKLAADWDNAYKAGNVDGLLAIYTSDVVRLGSNEAAGVGADALRASFQSYFDVYKAENHSPVEDVRVSGDLAVARGLYTGTSTPRAGGTPINEKGKWASAYQRQADGSWKIFWDIGNSDLPAVDAPPVGKDELTLLQIEREWAAAVLRKDAAALENILATEFVAHDSSGARNRKQTMDGVRNPSAKIESGDLSDMKVVVLGDTAVVHGLWTKRSTAAGKDTSSRSRWTDTFVKRDGRWQCVGSYSAKAE